MSGVEVITRDLSEHPQCPHGPTLLFSRKTNGIKRNFFTCAACRDRKHCNFFLYEDEWHKVTEQKQQMWEEEQQTYLETSNRPFSISKVMKLVENQRIYCMTCNCFIFDGLEEHSSHELKRNLSDFQLRNPTEILVPLDDAKKEAQYLFAGSTVETIVEIVQSLDYKQIVCIGTPKIHESISKTSISSILLDFDWRFLNFFPPSQFGWYNCFNHHFFHSESKQIFSKFLKKSPETVLIIDPPFGGRVEPLAYTLNLIRKQFKTFHNRDLGIFWIFPYFMEAQIFNSLPEFTMLDYKVNYQNHPLFQKGPKGRKMGSPVRIFTNIDASKITLPSNAYKQCKLCNRWVSFENKHCIKCNCCTSKDGRTYVHCDQCGRCVKPTWKHCGKCQRCAQTDHKCSLLEFKQECFHCKQTGHKKRNCPSVDHEQLQYKRKKIKVEEKRQEKLNKYK